MTNEQRSSRPAAPAAAAVPKPQTSLDNAPPPPPAPVAPPKPAVTVDIVAHVQSSEGMDMEIAIRNLAWEGSPAGVAVRAKAVEKALLAEGFKALPAPVAPVAVAGGGTATNAVLLVKEDGTRSCSIHGPGRYSPPAPNPRGGTYPGRWWCSDRDCKAREAKSG